MRTSYRIAVTSALLLAAIAIPSAAQAGAGTVHAVSPGQSIQDAIDAAAPGDVVLMRPGTYREDLEITTDRLTLRGHGARLEPPDTPTANRCSTFFGAAENPYGICVAGEMDPVTRAVIRPVQGVTVEGLTIGQYQHTGLVVLGGADTTVRRNDIAGGLGDGGYSVLVLRSATSRVVANRVHGAGGAGIYIGSSPQAQAIIAHNVAFDSGSFGIMVRDAVGGTVEHNLTYSNCMGIGFVDGFSAGTADGWTARHNTVLRNTDVCPGSDGDPDISGVGILLAGAHNIAVERNLVLGNAPDSDNVPYAGGVVLASGSVFGGTGIAAGNVITRNTVLGSGPFDLNLVEAEADNTFSHNTCRTASVPGLCTG